ncbi:hypothetical protein JWG42_14100 [Desulfoprunum benzoelyticum]|uniref:Uncharacterized protein n=1 Tax=Desulfoprunum benzoelyticum TaxID=1506996 RepID=A0A840UQM0_9BACT|nr:hypothetical protein [Desulfoprunum benzoelyticum]MBB5348517.1 hypothetical protein [Desulfoprunum benzoelyticum]MBM9531288.1 hypothetical protein [Desulfoprunum benzoelyticum]
MPVAFPDGSPVALINFVNEVYTSILQIKCIKYLDKPLFHYSPFVNYFSLRKSETNSQFIFLDATRPLYLLDGILVDQGSPGCTADRHRISLIGTKSVDQLSKIKNCDMYMNTWDLFTLFAKQGILSKRVPSNRPKHSQPLQEHPAMSAVSIALPRRGKNESTGNNPGGTEDRHEG